MIKREDKTLISLIRNSTTLAKSIICSECRCSTQICNYNNNNLVNNGIKCKNCIKDICCCIAIHTNRKFKKSLSISSLILSLKSKCKLFFHLTKNMYPIALGIEILCIMSAEIGENIGLYTFGFNLFGITLAYIIGYALAGFTTFMTILGRYSSIIADNNNVKIKSCCSILEQESQSQGFFSSMLLTFRNFTIGLKKIPNLRKQSNVKHLIKASLIILVTAESACILTAETIGIVFYNYSILLSIPLALLVGALTVVFIEAHRKSKLQTCDSCDCSSRNNDKNNNLLSLK